MYCFINNRKLEEREPVPGPWQQAAITYFLNQKSNDPIGNPESKETDGLCSTIPLQCRLTAEGVNEDVFYQQTEKFGKILTSNPYAMNRILTSAGLLRHCILHGGDSISIQEIEVLIQKRKELTGDEELLTELGHINESLNNSNNYSENVEKYGKACPYPGSFIGSFLALSLCHRDHLGYADTIRKVIKVGGCNCSRANFVGACLGAIYGIQIENEPSTAHGIPMEWILKTDKCLDIFELALNKVI